MTSNRIHYILKPGEAVVYFRNEFEQAVFRSVKGGDIYVKLKGGVEYKAEDGSPLVEETVSEANIDFIDQETYDNW